MPKPTEAELFEACVKAEQKCAETMKIVHDMFFRDRKRYLKVDEVLEIMFALKAMRMAYVALLEHQEWEGPRSLVVEGTPEHEEAIQIIEAHRNK